MDHLTSWVLVFIAGIVAGALVTSLLFRLGVTNKRRTKLVQARARILAGAKEQQEDDLRREIFLATDALKSEINKSLRMLLNSMERLLGQVHEDWDGQKKN